MKMEYKITVDWDTNVDKISEGKRWGLVNHATNEIKDMLRCSETEREISTIIHRNYLKDGKPVGDEFSGFITIETYQSWIERTDEEEEQFLTDNPHFR